MKFTIMQKIWLLFAMIAYGGFLACFYQKFWLGVLCAGVSSVVFFLLVLLRGTFSSEEADDEEMDEDMYHDRYNFDALLNQSAQRREKLEAAEDQLEASGARILSLEQENMFYKSKVESFDQEKEHLEKEVDDLRSQLVRMSDEKHTMISSLIPDADDCHDEDVDVAALAGEAAQRIAGRAQAANLRVNVVAPEEPVIVHMDAYLLGRVYDCIIDNAIRYMRRPGMLQITISRVGGQAFIVAKDDGEGLSQEEASHIFELNYRGSNSSSGNGLGLTQVKAIVEAYKGTVYAKSEQGKGMGIYIRLPESESPDGVLELDDSSLELVAQEEDPLMAQDTEDYTLL